jgi:hypothetical protein
MLGELSEIFGDGAADFAGENFGEGRNGAGRFIESDALHAVHREEEGWKARALLIRSVDLVDEMIERVEIDAANGDSRRVDGEKFAPQFFFRGMQADDDDGMRVHDSTFLAYRISRRRSGIGDQACAKSDSYGATAVA